MSARKSHRSWIKSGIRAMIAHDAIRPMPAASAPIIRPLQPHGAPREESRRRRARDNGAGHLRFASKTRPVEYGNLLDARAQCGGLDDHLRGPAEGAIAHAEAPEQVHADGAERADVRQAAPVTPGDQP